MRRFKWSLFFILLMASPLLVMADVEVVDASSSAQSGWVSSSGGVSGDDLKNQIANFQQQVGSLNDKLQQLTQSLNNMQTIIQAQGQEIQQLQSPQNVQPQQPVSQPVTQATVSTSGTEAIPSDQEKNIYDQAMDQIQNRQYSDAITTMKNYLGKYSSTGYYVASVHYWLGQLYAIAGMNDQARAELIVVVNNYPQSEKAPDALLKLGQIANDSTAYSQAKQYWQQIMDQYPNSAAARVAEGQLQKLKQANL